MRLMIQLKGPWRDGYAFDIHTIKSVFTGPNEFGRPDYDTTRSPMGQCIYELKYGQDLSVLDKIVDLIVTNAHFNIFIQKIDIILPVPPSNKYRRIQPVSVCSQKISEKYKKELRSDILSSANKEELKNIVMEKKYAKIKEAIKVDVKLDKTKNILIFDDIFDSGSTLKAITNALKETGYSNIYVFTLTKTRKAD